MQKAYTFFLLLEKNTTVQSYKEIHLLGLEVGNVVSMVMALSPISPVGRKRFSAGQQMLNPGKNSPL